jgi:hypothetical protein
LKKLALVAAALLGLGGCASVTHPSNQQITFETVDQSGVVHQAADCLVKARSTSLLTRSGEPVDVPRDDQDMTVQCIQQGLPAANGILRSRGNWGMLGNYLVFGGVLGATIDHASARGYNFPTTVRLVFGEKRFYDRTEQHKEDVLLGMDMSSLNDAVALRPSPSGFARLNDDSAPPKLSESGQYDYRSWLGWPNPKAFALSDTGNWYAAHGAAAYAPTDAVDPAARALAFCKNRNRGVACRLYAVDNDVVWVPGAQLVQR